MNATLPCFPADTAELSTIGGFLSVDVAVEAEGDPAA